MREASMDIDAFWASQDFLAPLVAGGLLALGLVQLLKYSRFRRHAERTRGVVLDLQAGVAAQAGQLLFHPVVEFMTRSGRQVRAITRVGTTPAPANVSEIVTVMYDPRDPEEVEIPDTQCTRLALLYLIVIVGIVFVGIAWL